MKLSEFILLDEPTVKSTLLHRGVLIGKRKSLDCLVFLFQMDDYYVETFCNVSDKSLCEYRAFKELNALGPYLESIEIGSLFS
ncbi:MAG TPA: hypothetical protein VF145_01830 [Chitinophagaceae bacterium]